MPRAYHSVQAPLTLGWQLIPGHEVIGTIAAVGQNVKGFRQGDRCVADPGVTVRHFSWFHVRLKHGAVVDRDF